MKKILFTIGLILICYLGYGQSNPYPLNQNIGAPTGTVKTPPNGAFYGGLIPYTFLDTSAANAALTYGKTYNGFTIYTQTPQATWWRLADSSKWIMILPQGGGTPVAGNAWLVGGNINVFSDGNNNATFGTNSANGMYWKINGTTQLYMPYTGIAPETGTTVGLGYDPSDSNRITLFSGSGATPTWQETLTAGSTLTTDNTIQNGANTLTFTNNTLAGDFGFIVSSNSTLATASGQTLGAFLLSGANATANQATTSLIISNTHTGTSSTNIGLNIVAQGANNNYALIVQPSGGYVGFGTTSPVRQLDVVGDVQFSTSSYTDGLFSITDATGIAALGDFNLSQNGTYFTVDDGNQIAKVKTSKFNISDGSLGTASAGYVWTLQNTGTGEGAWAAASGGSLSIGQAITSATAGSVLFAGTGGKLQQSNSKFFFDSTNVRLGIGTNSPSYPLVVTGSSAVMCNIVSSSYGNTFAVTDPSNSVVITGTEVHGFGSMNVYSNSTLKLGAGGNMGVTINSPLNVLIGGTADPASATASLGIYNGTAPTGSITNGTILYSEDVASSSELKVRDEAGNITVLSPHNFSKLGKPSEDLAWSYYSEKDGKYITVDMTKAIRTIEELTQRVYELEKKLDLKPKKPVKLLYKGKVKK